VEQGSIGFEFIADPDEHSSNENAGNSTPIDANASEQCGSKEFSTVGDEQGTVGFEFVTEPNASWDESSCTLSAGGSSVGDISSHEDVNQEASNLEDGDKNAPLTTQQEDVASAMKLVLLHPMRDITQKTRMKDWPPAELGRSKAQVKEYLLELFSLRYCFAKYPARFTKCSCLHNLRTECCFDSLAARIDEIFCLVFVFCITTTNLVLLLFFNFF
jgi:hypothetical protein